MVIAVDAVGGDHYPQSPVVGAIQATEEHEGVVIVLVGPEELIHKELEKHEFDPKKISVTHAPEIIEMDESPAQAVKSKKNSSISVGLGMQKVGKCDGFISAGNTGALLAASTFLLGKLEGVIRPTIAATYPTLKGFRLLLDAGANLEMRPDMYLQFARMGTIYAREVMNIENPAVGLLNVGEEEEKGTEVLKEAHQLLKRLPNFVGNIEGRDILFGKADVFVCDGYVGNVTLKFGESIPEALEQFLGVAVREGSLEASKAREVGNILNNSLSQFNYENVGGIPFLGVNGVSMVGHGGSSPLAIKNMILNAVKCIEHKINEKIVASLNS